MTTKYFDGLAAVEHNELAINIETKTVTMRKQVGDEEQKRTLEEFTWTKVELGSHGELTKIRLVHEPTAAERHIVTDDPAIIGLFTN